MYKLVFELLTDPLGLPINALWEYLILLIIGAISFSVGCSSDCIFYTLGDYIWSNFCISVDYRALVDVCCCFGGDYRGNYCSNFDQKELS